MSANLLITHQEKKVFLLKLLSN